VAAFFGHPTFQHARAEIEALGFALSDRAFPGSAPYAVVGGRSNARWWLVPLEGRRATVGGLAMFQPLLASARVLKEAALAASRIGLSRLWARDRVHIAGSSRLSDIFDERALRYAFFTGTESPHRKVAVQVMDSAGRIKGFAKATRDSAVAPLLDREADVLERVRGLELRTALVPSLLFRGDVGGARVLVTDTRRTVRSRTELALGQAHVAFLRELGERTTMPEDGARDWLPATLARQYASLAGRLPLDWRRRLERGIACVEKDAGSMAPRRLAHGDFTASNTFFADGSLYVFDWEYASTECSPGFDLVHFLLSAPAMRRQPAAAVLARIRPRLQELFPGLEDARAGALVAAYLCGQALRFAARELDGAVLETWAGEPETAPLLDAVVRSR
jgi:aminoglycoside phosphotransferase (APT) family kinase protein